MARPRKQTAEQRAEVVSVRLTAAEYSRQALLTGRVVVRRAGRTDPAVLMQLQRIGVNLNQIARTANTHGGVPDNLDQLCRTVREIVMRAIDQEG